MLKAWNCLHKQIQDGPEQLFAAMLLNTIESLACLYAFGCWTESPSELPDWHELDEFMRGIPDGGPTAEDLVFEKAFYESGALIALTKTVAMGTGMQIHDKEIFEAAAKMGKEMRL